MLLVFILLVSTNKTKAKKSENVNAQNGESFGNSEQALNTDSSPQKFKKIKDFDKRILMKKKPFFVKFFEEEQTTSDSPSPLFPSYEIIDDDDLL